MYVVEETFSLQEVGRNFSFGQVEETFLLGRNLSFTEVEETFLLGRWKKKPFFHVHGRNQAGGRNLSSRWKKPFLLLN